MKKNNRKNSDFYPVGDVLAELIKSIRREAPSDLSLIREAWNSVLDPSIAANAQPAALKGTSLLIHTASSTVTHQLRFLMSDIIKRLNTSLGKPMIHEIKCKVGNI
ncbi:MAG: DUF721 domain-containing protein [Deltaproteobacteria bacterium]|nr:DUF721 domain-containing protein [Deltaproteobacteria bacterium]